MCFLAKQRLWWALLYLAEAVGGQVEKAENMGSEMAWETALAMDEVDFQRKVNM
jgi:hypothetical protein